MVASPSQPDLTAQTRFWSAQDQPPDESVGRLRAAVPVGMVVFRTHRGGLAEALLDDSGVWSCPRLPVLDRVLNALFAPSPTDAGSPHFGRAELARVAAWIKGEVGPPRAPG